MFHHWRNCPTRAAATGGKCPCDKISGLRRAPGLAAWLDQLAQIGAIAGDGVCRLALTDEDKAGRDLVVRWMRELAWRSRSMRSATWSASAQGCEDGPPVMTGSHIDTVRTGGRYDGCARGSRRASR